MKNRLKSNGVTVEFKVLAIILLIIISVIFFVDGDKKGIVTIGSLFFFLSGLSFFSYVLNLIFCGIKIFQKGLILAVASAFWGLLLAFYIYSISTLKVIVIGSVFISLIIFLINIATRKI